MELLKHAQSILADYEKWVGKHPCTSAEVEAAIKYLSYIFTSELFTSCGGCRYKWNFNGAFIFSGQFENSNLLSELIFTLSKLLAFFNDQIIHKRVAKSNIPNPYENKLKKWLTIINHCEVFIELSAQKAWGARGKWMVILAIQLFK